MKVVLKEYLERLNAIEVMKPRGEPRKKVPNLTELAKLSGLHKVTISRIANNYTKTFKIESAQAIIKAMRDLGFDMQVSDFLMYEDQKA